MLREQRRRKQQVADKIGHEEYIYKLNGDAYSGQEEIRVRQQGDYDPRRAAAANNGGHRPPFAVDDDNNHNNNNGGGRRGNARPLNPITGAPADGGAALVPVRDNAPTSQNGPYASPYGAPAAYAGAFNNSPALYYPPSGGGGGAYAPQSLVPAMPPIAPLNDLPGPLPPVYRPKPPLTFHGNVAPSAAPLLYVPDGYNNNNNYSPYGGNGGYREDGARPSTSPTVLPPLSPQRANNNNNNNGGGAGMPNAQRSPRPSTSGAAGGGFVVGSNGLSDLEDRHKEKMAARQRAIELQQENARQMLEQHQRKAAEREREIREDREAEDRLRRERDEVARREQAEVDRERREKELKMMGPRAAQEMLEQQRKETEARREAEAAARRNRGRQQPQQQQQHAATPEKAEGLSDEKAETAPPKDTDKQPSNSPPNHNTGGDGDAALPLDQRAPISFPSGLQPFPQQPMQPPGMYPTQQYFANIGLGGAGITPPPPSSSSSSPYYAPFMLQRQQRIQLEGDVIHEELRHIALLLEAQQLNKAITHNTPPPPPPPQWAMGPQPASAGGAGTYLTTGMPSPLFQHNNHQQQQQQQPNYNNGGGYRSSPHPPSSGASYTSSLSSNANSPYRGFSAGGTMPPPPLSTATPQQGGGAAALLSGEGLSGPWPGLFTPEGLPGSQLSSSGKLYNNPISYTGAGGAAGAGGGGGAINASGFLSSYRGDGADSEELAIEPSCFVMPATVPPPPFVPPYALAPSTHHGPSASSSLGDVNDAKHAGPVERPGTGKPRGPSTPQHDAAATPPVRAEAEGQPPEKPAVSARGEEEALTKSELEPRPLSASASESSPVRGATPHLTSTEVVDADTSTPSERRTSAQQAVQRRRGDGAAVEPPVVVLTPRGGGKT